MKKLKTSVPIFILDFNLLSCELDNLNLKCYIESFYTDIIFKQNKFIIPTKFLVKNLSCENCVFFDFFNNKKCFFVFTSRCRYPEKLICSIAFQSAPSLFCLLKSIAINYNIFQNRVNLLSNQLCNHHLDQS